MRSEFRERALAAAGRRMKAKRPPRSQGGPRDADAARDGEPIGEAVKFASVVAEKRAAFRRLTWREFAADSVGATGVNGWTVADVERVYRGRPK